MGVPKFYRWTSERYPCLSEVINETQIPEFDNLYLDMNGIIHNCSHPNDDDVTFRITEEEIFVNIFAYIENLFNLIRPQKVFFMAIDGVAPRAKMNQQRARRFMSARTAAEQERKAREKGEVLPEGVRFDSNCITPGTHFMATLHQKLVEWVEKKAVESRWQGRRIILSGHNCAGEGEHKIMDFIRTERAKPDYDPNTRHCMYGLDADLIILGIVSHEPHFSLLREEVTFNMRPRKNEQKNKKPKRTDSAEKKFHLLHLSLLREYLAWEFSSVKQKLPFEYDMEKVADDWILMGLLVGNDFLPHLPNIHIHDDALPLLYSTYKKVLPKLDGYLNEGGYLNLGRFEKFLNMLSANDKDSFMDKLEDDQFLASKRTQPAPEDKELVPFESSDIEDEDDTEKEEETEYDEEDPAFESDDEEAEEDNVGSEEDGETSPQLDEFLEQEFNDELATLQLSAMDDKDFANNVEACWTRTINNSFKRHKKAYYAEKMRYKSISKAELRAQAEGYVRAIQWNLHYYYHGCVSWSWFYPHHYAPYISDITDFSNMKIEFELSKPFCPYEQLLAVLPEASSSCVPLPLRELMTSDPAQSEIHDFYPKTFETDLNGKRNDWEAVVLIPFIDEKRLLAAAQSKYGRLSAAETKRNGPGKHIQCVSVQSPSTDGTESTWSVVKTELDENEFHLPRDKVKWGLLPNVKMDVYFPGFPTMKHLSHTGELRFANCNVFGMASRKESMVLKVDPPSPEKDIIEWGSELCDEEVCIDWPILKLARVESVWGDGRIVRKSPDDEIIVKDMTDEEKREYIAHVHHLSDSLMTRYAIEVVGKKDAKGKNIRPAIVWTRRFTGLVYESVEGKDGQPPVLKAVKQWSSPQNVHPVLLPLVVKDVLLENSRLLSQLPMREAFPLGSVVYVTTVTNPLYGQPSIVTDYRNEKDENCQLKLMGSVQDPKVNLMTTLHKKLDQKSLRWMGAYDCSRQIQMNSNLFARITGTMILWNEPREKVEKGQQISSDSKINCGLSLKFSRRDICTADYTDRVELTNTKGVVNKSWIYSSLTTRIVAEYQKKFPEVFRYFDSVQMSVMDDVYYAEDIWTDATKRDERFKELREFLDNIPSRDAEQFKCGTVYADRAMIAEIEKAVGKAMEGGVLCMLQTPWVKPKEIFRYELYNGKIYPDPDADFELLDRVAMVSKELFQKISMTVLGTVVGVHDDKIDVYFDSTFEGGCHVRGSVRAAAYRVPASSLFNLTFGLVRKFAQAKKKEKQDMEGAYVELPPKGKKQAEKEKKQQKEKAAAAVETHPSSSNSNNSKAKKNGKKEKQQEKVVIAKPPQHQAATAVQPSTDALTDSLNKLLNIGSKNSAAASTSPEEKPSTSSVAPATQSKSLIELMGGKKQQKKKNQEAAPSSSSKIMGVLAGAPTSANKSVPPEKLPKKEKLVGCKTLEEIEGDASQKSKEKPAAKKSILEQLNDAQNAPPHQNKKKNRKTPSPPVQQPKKTKSPVPAEQKQKNQKPTTSSAPQRNSPSPPTQQPKKPKSTVPADQKKCQKWTAPSPPPVQPVKESPAEKKEQTQAAPQAPPTIPQNFNVPPPGGFVQRQFAPQAPPHPIFTGMPPMPPMPLMPGVQGVPGFGGMPIMGMMPPPMHQQHQNYNQKRANPTLTDFKPSTVNNNRRHNQMNRKQKVTMISKPAPPPAEEPQKAPTPPPAASAAAPAAADPTASEASKKQRKKKTSRLAINFTQPPLDQ